MEIRKKQRNKGQFCGEIDAEQHRKGWEKPNQEQCDADCTCGLFFQFDIGFLLIFIMLFEFCITGQDKRMNSALHEVVTPILIGGGKGVMEHKVKQICFFLLLLVIIAAERWTFLQMLDFWELWFK